MAKVALQRDSLVVEMEGFDRVWCQERQLVVPLTNVKGARRDPDLGTETPWLGAGWKALLPGSVAAGPMIVEGQREFWDVRDPNYTIVVDLQDERYSRLVIDVADPGAAIKAINAAAKKTKARKCEKANGR